MEQKRQQALNLKTNEFEVLVTHVEKTKDLLFGKSKTLIIREIKGESPVLLGRPLQRWS